MSFRRWEHVGACPYPEGCNCGASEHNGVLSKMELLEKELAQLRESNTRLERLLKEESHVTLKLKEAVALLHTWFDRTHSLNGEEAHDVRGLLFMLESWLSLAPSLGENK